MMDETEIFAKAVEEKDPVKRNRILDQMCASDESLRTRLAKMLDAHDSPNTFFEDPFRSHRGDELTQENSFEPGLFASGIKIGPYKLLQEIGEGGMGLVFMAEQTEPMQRKVALKVIKPGMDSRKFVARFEAERQALAMMDHPNIARVFDAGKTENGYPFFVMELVNGCSITEYCDRETLTTQQRLSLFISVCRAVQHAHQKGVIHRDLKPGNILVAEYDGTPVPKVIDFGVAKAAGAQLTEKTLFTEFGQVIGTVEYMSPEQSRRNQLDIDTRSDIYSLGIVLYKLLTGETPFGRERFRKAAWDEMMKIISEEEPPLPSEKITSSDSLRQIAKNRKVDPGRLSSLVRGDLDWIVLKTLEKDRNHRYPSAGQLADDIQRHLEDQPVLARPQNSVRWIGKFAKRNRKQVWAAIGLFLAFCCVVYMAIKAANDLEARNSRVLLAVQATEFAITEAESSPMGDESKWEIATVQCQRLKEALDAGILSQEIINQGQQQVDDFEFKLSEHNLAVQIEEVVINGASNPDLASWEKMEQEMREFFLDNGFDLDREDPMEIGKRIRDHKSMLMWSDLLELWIATRGQMQSLGGPKLNAAIMQPWAEAIYIADKDPIRTGIRKFIYAPPRKKEILDELLEGVDLKTLSPRTLSWIGTCHAMVQDTEKANEVFELGLELYPRDVMLVHDYGFMLYHQQRFQESARMYHRCLTLRHDVPGLWISLSRTLEKLDETEAARRAMDKANTLKTSL